MAVVEPRLTLSMPPALTADTGIDALTHALEAAVSIFASPYTDAFCVQAVYQILPNLPRAFDDGADLEARTAHGERGHDRGAGLLERIRRREPRARPRRRARASASPTAAPTRSSCRTCCATTRRCPSKFMPAPGYTAYVAPEKYAQIAWIIGLGGKTEEQRRERLFAARRGAARRRRACRARSSRRRRGPRRVRRRPARAGARRLRATRASAPTRASRSCASSSELLEAGFDGW